MTVSGQPRRQGRATGALIRALSALLDLEMAEGRGPSRKSARTMAAAVSRLAPRVGPIDTAPRLVPIAAMTICRRPEGQARLAANKRHVITRPLPPRHRRYLAMTKRKLAARILALEARQDDLDPPQYRLALAPRIGAPSLAPPRGDRGAVAPPRPHLASASHRLAKATDDLVRVTLALLAARDRQRGQRPRISLRRLTALVPELVPWGGPSGTRPQPPTLAESTILGRAATWQQWNDARPLDDRSTAPPLAPRFRNATKRELIAILLDLKQQLRDADQRAEDALDDAMAALPPGTFWT